MDISLLVLMALVLVVMVAVFLKGGWQLLVAGFAQSGRLIRMVFFQLILGLILGGLIMVLVPGSLVLEWLGPASGLKGILIATFAGVIIGGSGPPVLLPIVVSLLAAGAGVGPVIALLASWNLVTVRSLLIWQIPFLGAKLAITQFFVYLAIPPIVGILGSYIYKLIT